MSVDFSAFDNKVDQEALQKEIAAAKDTQFEDVPKGTYVVGIEKMEVGLTKKKDKVLFTMCCKIKEGNFKNRLLFFNRVISGNTSPKWTDAQAIKSVITLLDKFETQTVPEFINYGDFAECVLEIFQEIQGNVEAEIEWDPDGFNSISVKEVYDC